MQLEDFRRRLEQAAREYTLDIRQHAEFRLLNRQMSPEDVLENLRHPDRLERVREGGPDVFVCHFRLGYALLHRYVLQFDDYNKTLRVLTVMKIKRA